MPVKSPKPTPEAPPQEPKTFGWDTPPTFAPPLENDKDKPAELSGIDFADYPAIDPHNPDVDVDVQFGSATPGGEPGSASLPDSPPPPPIQTIERPSFIKPLSVADPEIINFGDTPADPEPVPADPAPTPDPAPPPALELPPAPPEEKNPMTLALEIVNRLLTERGQSVNGSMSYEQMALAILSVGCAQYLPGIREAASAHAEGSIAGWLLGAVALIGDRGDFGNIAYNPDWQKSLQAQAMAPNGYAPPMIANCEGCGHPYRPPLGGNIRQRYCCNACGKRAQGYKNEPYPHGSECTTDPGRKLKEALEAAPPVVAHAA